MPRKTRFDARRKRSKRGQCSLTETYAEDDEVGYETVPTLNERDRRVIAAILYEVAAHPENYANIQET